MWRASKFLPDFPIFIIENEILLLELWLLLLMHWIWRPLCPCIYQDIKASECISLRWFNFHSQHVLDLGGAWNYHQFESSYNNWFVWCGRGGEILCLYDIHTWMYSMLIRHIDQIEFWSCTRIFLQALALMQKASLMSKNMPQILRCHHVYQQSNKQIIEFI